MNFARTWMRLQEHYSNTSDYKTYANCCKLFCGEPGRQLLQLQCQDASRAAAIVAWVVVATLLSCAVGQMLSISVGRGWRKVDMVGGPVYLSFIAFVVYLVNDRFGTTVDTPLYPIVGAMNVAGFSYYFSSFKYSIGLAYELASAVALVLTLSPVWAMLTITVKASLYWDTLNFPRADMRKLIRLVLIMLVSSVLFVFHSCCHRTVAYRAAWIHAFNKQKSTQERKNVMKKLWVLAGAQGHPRTPAGQSIGLYLAVLAWVLSVSMHNLLKRACIDDLILFHLLLWTAPSILTVAVLVTQINICVRNFPDFRGNSNILSQWFQIEYESIMDVFSARKQYYEALISYRLGRDTPEVESNTIGKYKLGGVPCCVDIDRCLSIAVFFLEITFLCIALPGTFVLGVIRLLGICFLKVTSRKKRALNIGDGTSMFICFRWCRAQPNEKEKLQAYRRLCEYCSGPGEETSRYYEDSGLESPAIDEEVRELFRNHRLKIRLPLLLDNIAPSGFTYLLQQLVSVLNEHGPTEEQSHPLVQIDREDSEDSKSTR